MLTTSSRSDWGSPNEIVLLEFLVVRFLEQSILSVDLTVTVGNSSWAHLCLRAPGEGWLLSIVSQWPLFLHANPARHLWAHVGGTGLISGRVKYRAHFRGPRVERVRRRQWHRWTGWGHAEGCSEVYCLTPLPGSKGQSLGWGNGFSASHSGVLPCSPLSGVSALFTSALSYS